MKTSWNHAPQIQRVVQIAILVVSIAFLFSRMAQNWNRVRGEIDDLNWGYIALGELLLILTWGLLAFPTYLALKSRNLSLSFSEALSVFNVSQLVKYLPGGFWAIPGRMVLYQRRYHFKVNQALSLVLWETFALLVGAILMGGLVIPTEVSPLLRIAWLALTIGLLLTFQFRRKLQTIETWITRRFPFFATVFQNESTAFTLKPSTAWKMLLATLLFWLTAGLGFHLLSTAVTHSSSGLGWTQSIGIYSLAWAIGFLVVFAPAGIGIREGVLVFLLEPFVTNTEAIVIALLARLWWTIAEAFWIAVSLWLIHMPRSESAAIPLTDSVRRK